MVVDDEQDLLYVLQKQLSTWYRVDVFTSPVEAIKHAENAARHLNYYDIILSDIRMQSIDGFEFARIMKKQYPQTKIILMTAFMLMKEEFEQNKLHIPADDIIVKPFAISHLQITISRLLNRGQRMPEHMILQDILSAASEIINEMRLMYRASGHVLISAL